MTPTARQLQVLRFIQGHIVAKGYCPSYADICDAFGWESKHSAFLHVSALIRDGYLEEKAPHIARALVLSEKARALLAAEREAA